MIVVALLGYGNMAQAIVARLRQEPQYHIHVAAPSLSTELADGIYQYPKNCAAIVNADVVILAIKPKDMDVVLADIYPALPKQAVIISIAAGIPLAWLAKRLPPHTAIIRTMPNIAAAVGCSATPLCANNYVTLQQKNLATTIFTAIGLVAWIKDEEQIDAFTALSGSGPAYVMLLLEAMTSAGEQLGLDSHIAQAFAVQTVLGAVRLVQARPTESLTALREAVTSPGGTTAAALEILMDSHGLSSLISKAMHAAAQRAHELSKE